MLIRIQSQEAEIMHIHSKFVKIFALLLLFLVCIPGGAYAEETETPINDTHDEPVMEESSGIVGLLYNGTIDPDSSVTVTAGSGATYAIPGNTPMGVLQSLENSGVITKISVIDGLMAKKGILLLDGIGNLSSRDENGWFVKVNGERLEDVVLSEMMGLNRYILKEGDVVLYSLGDPKGMVSESKAYLTVAIGTIREPSPEPPAEETDANLSDAQEENFTPIPTDSSSDVEVNEETTPSGEIKTSEGEPDSSEKPVTESQGSLHDGTLSLPSGVVTIATSGGDYDIDAATPLGILQKLMEDDQISDISVSDRAMKKGGILFLEGINDYHFSGDKTWFVLVNNVLLKDYLSPETDGLNTYKIKSGDEVGYYFGEPSRPADDAEVKMIITIG